MKKEYIIPIFVPHLGCPNDCVFCNQKSISGTKKNITKEEMKKIIEDYLKYIESENVNIEIAFYGGSFTVIDENIQTELLEVANEYIKDKENKISGIRISTRPDGITKDILKKMKKYNVKTIELGVQTTNNYILDKINRGHTFEDVKNASKLIKRFGIKLGHQMMIGLPESTREDEIKTAKEIIKLKPKMVRIYPVLVVKDTQLQKDFEEEKYNPMPLVKAVEISKELVAMFNSKKIEIIRVGLQSTDEITTPEDEKSAVVAGPYHPAFRQLVESGLWYDAIVSKIKKLNDKVLQVQINVNPQDVNNVIGHKKENILKLKELYNVDIFVKQDEKIKQGKMKLDILKKAEDFAKI